MAHYQHLGLFSSLAIRQNSIVLYTYYRIFNINTKIHFPSCYCADFGVHWQLTHTPAFVTRIQNYNHVRLFYLMVLKGKGYSAMHKTNVEALVSYLVLSVLSMHCPGK